MTGQELLKEIDPHYFWDVDVGSLDTDKSKRLIIERVFSLGTFGELRLLVNHYGESEVVAVLKKLNYLDPKTLNFVSKYFDVPLNEFKCYTRIQLTPPHWNF
jgi:hypothetical protein